MNFRHPDRRITRGLYPPKPNAVPAYFNDRSGANDIAMLTYGPNTPWPVTPSQPSREVERQKQFPWLFVWGTIYGVIIGAPTGAITAWWML